MWLVLEDRLQWKLQCWTEIAVVEWHLKKRVWIPRDCALFSSGNESLYPKGHASSALSPEWAELITHAQSCNNWKTKGSYKEPGSLLDDALEWTRAIKTGLDEKEARSEILVYNKTPPGCEPRATCGSPVSRVNHRSKGDSNLCVLQNIANYNRILSWD